MVHLYHETGSTILAASYIIRDVRTGLVLQRSGDWAVTQVREENDPAKRELQTWWIEEIPEREGSPVYTITSLATGTSLDALKLQDASKLSLLKSHGAPWQQWIFSRLHENKDGEFYNIINVHSGLALDKGELSIGFRTHMWTAQPNNEFQIWELVHPVCSMPVGWHRIKNVSTGHILSHSYLSSPPLVIQETPPTDASSYRATWDTQWLLIHGSAYKSCFGIWSYHIRNRLTGGFLRIDTTPAETAKIGVSGQSVNAWRTTSDCNGEDDDGKDDNGLWNLELDSGGNWKIINEGTKNLLGEVADMGHMGKGYKAVCGSRQPDLRRSWQFVPVQDIDATVHVKAKQTILEGKWC